MSSTLIYGISVKCKNSILKKKGGFTMVEVIVIVSVLGVLTGMVVLLMGDTINSAKDNTRKTNAMMMNKQISQIRALGGNIADGVADGVDTTSMETVINSLTKTPPLNVSGITFALSPKPDSKEYRLVEAYSGAKEKVVEAILVGKAL